MGRREFDSDMAMFYATGNGGLSGEYQRIWPQSYLDTHVVENGGKVDMDPEIGRAVKLLLDLGWVERRERTIEVPEDTQRFSMSYGTPAHTLISVTYHATPKGREEWGKKRD